jgi:hypothetical protein
MSGILNLKDHEIVFTTSFEHMHGLSGHLYEMIEYHYIFQKNGINSLILLSDGTDKKLLIDAIERKYCFTDEEKSMIFSSIVEHRKPKIIIADNICIVDGSSRFSESSIISKNVFLLRCSDRNFDYFLKNKTIKNIHLLQDFDVYEDKHNYDSIKTVDYVKKILWQKYKVPKSVKTETALLYLTTNCRSLSIDYILEITKKYNSFKKFLIITNDEDRYNSIKSDRIDIVNGPIDNIFEKFDAYIYTPIERKFDCSPRFIVECAVYNKDVYYELDYVDLGIESRKQYIKNNIDYLMLKENDEILDYFKENI